MYDSIAFDLDGTLWDACAPCAVGWTEALHSCGYPQSISKQDIESICGLPTPDCIRKLCPQIPIEDFERVMDKIKHDERTHIEKIGGELYPGVVEGLRELSQSYPLFLVSNCQEWYLRFFMRHSATEKLFRDSDCFGRTGKPKSENLKNLALKHDLKKPLYVGDTHWDQQAASSAGYDFAFASYGFGRAEIAAFTVDHFALLVEKLNS